MQPIIASNKAVSAEAFLSGALGIVIVPDQATIERAYALAAEILPPKAEYVLAAGSIPHLTLYHGKLKDVPADEVRRVVTDIRMILAGQRFSLGPIIAYGGNFVFWNVEQNTDIKLLLEAHGKALAVAQFLDRMSEAKATSEEGLTLTEVELENVKQFGHPLVRQLYTPHITLGFHRGISQTLATGLYENFEFSIASIEMARIGYPGRVKSLVGLENAV